LSDRQIEILTHKQSSKLTVNNKNNELANNKIRQLTSYESIDVETDRDGKEMESSNDGKLINRCTVQ
jgi:hypothetical protein